MRVDCVQTVQYACTKCDFVPSALSAVVTLSQDLALLAEKFTMLSLSLEDLQLLLVSIVCDLYTIQLLCAFNLRCLIFNHLLKIVIVYSSK